MSPDQLAANRANAQLSTGPISEAGKQIVSRNSLKHGLTGTAHAALPGEQDALEKHCEGFRQAYAPLTLPEHELVRNIAENYWRLKRAHAMENALFARIEREQADELAPASAHADAWIDPLKGLQRIALYAARIQRAIEKTTAALIAMQAAHRAARSHAQEEAILLSKLAESLGQIYDPAVDFPPEAGFVFSAPEIARIIDRARRLEEARARFAPGQQSPIM